MVDDACEIQLVSQQQIHFSLTKKGQYTLDLA